MKAPQHEVAEIVRQYGAEFIRVHGTSLSAQQYRVLNAVTACRTAELGGHLDECDACGYQKISYNSCRNRHCPKCQGSAAARWLDLRRAELLPVPYFHVVFTIPAGLAPLALQNKRIVYGLLFRAVSQTLLAVASDPRHLGARIGVLAILHTWGQNLRHHPHLHCVVPNGGLSPDGSEWIAGRPDFFLPVRVLSRVFRGKFLALLRRAYSDGDLRFHGALEHLSARSSFDTFVQPYYEQEWVVYAKAPFGGPEQVLKYLARYTHRVAISNRRLVSIDDHRITFRWKDYSKQNQCRRMTLTATEFLRRWLLHVLPRGFVRIRHYGLFANRDRKERLRKCQQLLMDPEELPATTDVRGTAAPPLLQDRGAVEGWQCPRCNVGRVHCTRQFEPGELPTLGLIFPGPAEVSNDGLRDPPRLGVVRLRRVDRELHGEHSGRSNFDEVRAGAEGEWAQLNTHRRGSGPVQRGS